MKQQGFSLFPLHFQLQVQVVKDTQEMRTVSPWVLVLDTWSWCLLLYLQFLSLHHTLKVVLTLDCFGSLSSVISYLKLQVAVIWTEVTNSLSSVQHLESCRGFENGEFEELDYSCWFILLVASAACRQRSVLSPECGIISWGFFPEWLNSQKCWFGEWNQGEILRLSGQRIAGLNYFFIYSSFLLG